MPTEYIVLNSGELVLQKLTGPISHQEVLNKDRRVYEDSSIRVGAVAIVDARQASFPGSPIEKADEVAEVYASLAKTGLLSKIALVAPPAEEDFRKCAQVESLMTRYGISFILFANMEVACTWIGVDSKWIEERFHSMLPS